MSLISQVGSMSKTADQTLHHSCRSDITDNEDNNKIRVLMENLPEGVSLFDWEKGNVLGQGSFGVVYLGMPTKPYLCNVAIKTAPLRKVTSLIREMIILKKCIGSPEIVQLIGDASTNNSVYNIILEYAAGGSLRDLIKTHKKLPERNVREYLRMILRGLSCLHAKGFVHCDLKPDNILVFPSSDGKIKLKIADLGLSKEYKYQGYMREEEEEEGHTSELKFIGTPRYMSPESLTGEIKPALDIWSLGCVMIKMISGESIWNDCSTKKKVLSKLVYEKKIPNIPRELSNQGKDFLQKCFERNPEQRWSADMLLKHPYLVEEKRITKKSIKSLPFFKELYTIMILFIIFYIILF